MKPKLLFHDTHGFALFKRAQPLLKQGVAVLMDVGAGIRPQQMVRAHRHVCAEPCADYADRLVANGYEVIRLRAREALEHFGPVDTVVALDVIEHMERAEGEAFRDAAMKFAREQVVIFTPLGFMEQHGGDEVDPWGLQGQQWQEHRSGWTPDDFPGWTCLVDPKFYGRRPHRGRMKAIGAFFAIWNR